MKYTMSDLISIMARNQMDNSWENLKIELDAMSDDEAFRVCSTYLDYLDNCQRYILDVKGKIRDYQASF